MLEILKMAQMLNEMQASQQTGDPMAAIKTAVANKQKINPQIIKDSLYSPSVKMLKTAIPLMDQRYQRSLEIFIKYTELSKLVELYNGIAANISGLDSDWRTEMLNAMRPHLDENRQEMVDMAVWMLDTFSLTQKMRKRSVGVHGGY